MIAAAPHVEAGVEAKTGSTSCLVGTLQWVIGNRKGFRSVG